MSLLLPANTAAPRDMMDAAPAAQDLGPGWMISYLDVFILTSALFASLLMQSETTNQALQEELQQRVPAEVAVAFEGERAELAIGGEVLFARSDAQLSDKGRELLTALVPMILESQGEVLIEGHTDSQPISTPEFPSNWELAAARATQVLRYLAGQGIPTERLRAISYADTRPVVANDSAANRKRNRRVGIVLLGPAT